MVSYLVLRALPLWGGMEGIYFMVDRLGRPKLLSMPILHPY